uniref:Autophagy-related protein 9 n=1 Tax=Elaeis guineensis var. tenera TaxID=51953 RepID=A0A6I9R313_ELAGV|nr:autophagy-related protein 9 isoform X1 [Elaeis guineensis]
MMSSAQKGAIAPSRFEWPWRSEASLTTQLLSDAPPEIELSDYRRLPRSGSESPSGLLNDEGLKSEPIADLDLFFERLYNYYCEKGLRCIIIKWIVEILNVIFMICFIAFFLLFVDWNALLHAKCGMEAVESGEKPCDLAKEVIKQHPLVPLTFTKVMIVGSMVILTFYGLFNFLKFFVQFKNMVKIRHFYYNSLNVTDREIQTTPWPKILEKLVQLQKSQQLCVVKDLSAHEVIMRIMRKENYLIGMLNRGILAFPISSWVPGVGPAVNSRTNGRKHHLILPKTLEWTLNWCIFQSMFDSKFCVRREFLTNSSLLKKRLVVVGIGMFLIAPCIMIFMLVYLFLRHAEQFYNHPSIASSRRWSNLSKWIFREFNEVDHLFKHRINSSVANASNYLKQFPSPLITIIAKFISFVSGGFAAILIIIGILDESLLEGHVFGRNLFWYAAVFGTVTAISRAAVTEELQVLDPEGAMSLVVQQTHYMPNRWRGRENSDSVRVEFETLFQYTGMMLVEEMASILVTPYLLIFVVPKRVDDILRFISDFTVYVEGVGHVCSLSLFDFERHGNRKYGSPFDAARDMRSSQGKLEKSFLSFQSTYQFWEPSAHGQLFLSNLSKFREQHMHHPGSHQQCSPNRTWQFTSSLRGQGEITHRSRNVCSRGICTNDYPLDHCLLDWYYTSRPLHPVDNSNDLPPSSFDAALSPGQDMWSPMNRPEAEFEVQDKSWDLSFSDRIQSHLEASTSSPFLRDDIVQQRHSVHHAINPWWARPIPQSSGPQASFLEPPNFGDPNISHHSDYLSERSMEDQGSDDRGDENWKNIHTLSRTMYMDDSDKDEGLDLHFVDDTGKNRDSNHQVTNVFGGPLLSLPVRIIPRSNDPV